MCGIENGIGAALGLFSIFDSIQTARTEKAIGNYNSQQMILSAKEMEQKSRQQYQEGIEKSRKKKLDAIVKMNSQKTQIASGNLSLASVTSTDILNDTKLIGELDALETFNSYKESSYDYMKSAQDYYDKAALNSFKTNNQYKKSLFRIF